MTANYNDLTKDQLIQLLSKRDRQRKLGLVWERNEIEADAAIDANFVVGTLQPALCERAEPWSNLIIEADNYDALRWLRMVHPGKVDCIYIDPPYNTGNKDWVYNDHFISKEDRYRQSTWLEFLYRRLILARDLLAEKGVLLVSINDEQRAKLDMLLDEVFPGMRIGSFVWRTKDTANDAEHNFSAVHEHVLVYGRSGFSFLGDELDQSKYKYDDQDGRGAYSSTPITQPKTHVERKNGYYPIQDPETGWWYPANPDSVWRYASAQVETSKKKLHSETIEALIAAKRIIFPATESITYTSREDILRAIAARTGPVDGNGRQLLRADLPDLDFWIGKPIALGRPSRKSYWAEKTSTIKPVGSMILGGKQIADPALVELRSEKQGKATGEIREIFGSKRFQYPKPASLIKSLIETCLPPDGLILDFFAGSGTTGQAVMELNAADGGTRRFILVSSREATKDDPDYNLCRDITAERIRLLNASRAKKYEDLAAGFAYLTCERLDFEDLDYDLSPSAAWTALEMLHQLPLTEYDAKRGWNAHETDAQTLVLVDQFDASLTNWLESRTRANVTVYSWAPGQVSEALAAGGYEVRSVHATLVQGFQQ